ncbi:universal stress protein [Psychrobacter sp. FDAARGOS_221]|uniref:universal stress protein n=1 Tax=Psychrobacter sp. FDAARGOS_221 TaxID=1975705 RepID=UPI000BB55E67|nr:universal stress protein [Psychrobacter sp. FDAARGOS_221]PNK60975.1 universal stress protein [Psychrobacter sp. FDAARGOS_221]
MSYKHILLVTDLRSDADVVAQKAKIIHSRQTNAQFSVLHIIKDTVVGFGYEMVPAASLYDEIDDERRESAKSDLVKFLERNGLDCNSQEVTTAISNSEGIINYCDKHDVDLVVIGRHERHGISAWINGATADCILPNVPCDVLVVKLDKPVKD